MRFISKKVIREFWEKYPDSKQPLRTWHREASRLIWHNPNQVKMDFARASIIGNSRASEILSRKRKLSLEMMRNLHDKLNISYESLMGRY